jgi:hypothetical protein
MNRFITGEKFKDLANYSYTPEVKYNDDFNDYGNSLDVSKLKDGDIIYTHTMFVKQLFEVLKTDKKVKLISHNCDAEVSYKLMCLMPDSIFKWYSQNVNVSDPRIESLPIGLENNRWFPDRRKKEKILSKMNERRDYRNLVYMNFNIGTNPTVRGRIYDLYEGESWVTSERGSNAQGRFDQYLANIYNHKFVISPQGNGLDTHRTWECLYIGTIPIEKWSLNSRFYTDLPICFVENWEDITEGFLESEFERIKSQEWNFEKLDFEYWRRKICAL